MELEKVNKNLNKEQLSKPDNMPKLNGIEQGVANVQDNVRINLRASERVVGSK